MWRDSIGGLCTGYVPFARREGWQWDEARVRRHCNLLTTVLSLSMQLGRRGRNAPDRRPRPRRRGGQEELPQLLRHLSRSHHVPVLRELLIIKMSFLESPF